MEAARAKRPRRIIGLTDPDVLDCPICYEFLASPVFQCENGHVACSSCCNKMNKCSFCHLLITIRNRAIEKVIESAKLTCKNEEYGCNETMSYNQKCVHEKTCQYAPCSCPISDCNFIGSSSQLYQHFTDKHKDSATKFQYDKFFQVSFNTNDKVLVLQEEKDSSLLYILQNTTSPLGKALSVTCTCSRTMSKRYKISTRFQRNNLVMESTTGEFFKHFDYPSMWFLMVPMFNITDEKIPLKICIHRR